MLSSAPALVNVRGLFAPALFALALLALLVTSPATSAAQEPTEASVAPKDGLERRQALPPSPAKVSINGALRGGVQWILSGPNQLTGRRNRDVIVPGLRAVTVF